jgi:hypothetical protein
VRSLLDYLDRDEEADVVTAWLLEQALPICQRMYAAHSVTFGLRMAAAQFFSVALPDMLRRAAWPGPDCMSFLNTGDLLRNLVPAARRPFAISQGE